MTLYEVVRALERIALTHPSIKTAKDGSVYDVMNNNPSVEYGTFVVTQNMHRQTEQFDKYGLILFYIDRLNDDMDSNRLQIQSLGKQLLGNIIKCFCEEFDVDFPTEIRYTPFTQKFQDSCAGEYATLELEIPIDVQCAEIYD